MALMFYILISSTILGVLYLTYRLIYRNEGLFSEQRYFLLAIIILSLFLPLNRIEIKLQFAAGSRAKEEIFTPSQNGIDHLMQNSPAKMSKDLSNSKDLKTPSLSTKLNFKKTLKIIYFSVTFLLLVRIIFQIISFLFVYFTSIHEKFDNYIIIYNQTFKNNFSFFGWIFIYLEDLSGEEKKDILAHEKIHADQLHSLDLILVELLAAVMWFNPLVWMMRNSIQLVHEYLADEGALSTGIDKLRYQALLINQVTEEKLICLSSSFNHSLIKKRMIMMSKSKNFRKTKLKILTLIPLSVLLFLGISCINAQKKGAGNGEDGQGLTAVAPVKMNVLYLGVENPVNVAVSGIKSSEIEVSIDNGTISGSNGSYIVRPKEPGSAIITVSSDGEEIRNAEFRVKTVPNPIATVGGNAGGNIEKAKLLEQKQVVATMRNFDFDLSFKVIEFAVSATKKGMVKTYKSDSVKITNKQLELIRTLPSGSNVYFEDIKAMLPDGAVRQLPTIKFTLK